jgi:hypothetical protein
MSRVHLVEEFFYVQFSAATRIERMNTLIDFHAKSSQLFHMGEQIPANLFLIGHGKVGHLFYGVFEYLRHLTHRHDSMHEHDHAQRACSCSQVRTQRKGAIRDDQARGLALVGDEPAV